MFDDNQDNCLDHHQPSTVNHAGCSPPWEVLPDPMKGLNTEAEDHSCWMIKGGV